jgi:hypothetical protein
MREEALLEVKLQEERAGQRNTQVPRVVIDDEGSEGEEEENELLPKRKSNDAVRAQSSRDEPPARSSTTDIL